jgi:hypothetical protein
MLFPLADFFNHASAVLGFADMTRSPQGGDFFTTKTASCLARDRFLLGFHIVKAADCLEKDTLHTFVTGFPFLHPQTGWDRLLTGDGDGPRLGTGTAPRWGTDGGFTGDGTARETVRERETATHLRPAETMIVTLVWAATSSPGSTLWKKTVFTGYSSLYSSTTHRRAHSSPAGDGCVHIYPTTVGMVILVISGPAVMI